MAPNSGAPSSTRTGRPRRASASAVVSPPSPPPMMRMGWSSIMGRSVIAGRRKAPGPESIITKLSALEKPCLLQEVVDLDCGLAASRRPAMTSGGLLLHPDPLDLPFELDAGIL